MSALFVISAVSCAVVLLVGYVCHLFCVARQSWQEGPSFEKDCFDERWLGKAAYVEDRLKEIQKVLYARPEVQERVRRAQRAELRAKIQARVDAYNAKPEAEKKMWEERTEKAQKIQGLEKMFSSLSPVKKVELPKLPSVCSIRHNVKVAVVALVQKVESAYQFAQMYCIW